MKNPSEKQLAFDFDLVNFYLDLPDELHMKIKSLAGQKGQSVEDFIVAHVTDLEGAGKREVLYTACKRIIENRLS